MMRNSLLAASPHRPLSPTDRARCLSEAPRRLMLPLHGANAPSEGKGLNGASSAGACEARVAEELTESSNQMTSAETRAPCQQTSCRSTVPIGQSGFTTLEAAPADKSSSSVSRRASECATCSRSSRCTLAWRLSASISISRSRVRTSSSALASKACSSATCRSTSSSLAHAAERTSSSLPALDCTPKTWVSRFRTSSRSSCWCTNLSRIRSSCSRSAS
mmetsp:Transcript_1957/g.5935  ORF Transcript_1957/g.5935 Transcript_1957/m.5935 type:complete len:219 (-) Transcript_1957:507-1163(-)